MLDATVVENLLARLSEGEVDDRSISCQGLVKYRRRHGSATFLTLETDGVTVQVVLTAASDCTLSQLPVGLGCSIWCAGNPACDRPGSLSIYATDIQLLKIPPDVKQIAKVLEAVAKSFITKAAAAQLLRCSEDRVLQLVELQKEQAGDYRHELRQQVFALTGGKEVDGKIAPPPSARQRKAKVSKSDLAFLEYMERRLVDYEPLNDTWVPNGSERASITSENIPDAASARGPLSKSEYFHGKKWPQIEWFLGRLEALRTGNTFAHVLDVGGGRGDLAIHIASAFGVKVTVVDTNHTALQAGKEAADTASKRSDHCQLPHLLSFINMDFRVAAEQLPADIDFVVALHACGGLSDAALDFAVSRQICFMICPCCHLKNLHLEPKNGWSSLCEAEAKNMMNTRQPQAKNCGSVNETDEEADQADQALRLRRLAEIDRRDISWRALYIIAALRLQAIKKRADDFEVSRQITCKLATFAEEHSLRNLVLCGFDWS